MPCKQIHSSVCLASLKLRQLTCNMMIPLHLYAVCLDFFHACTTCWDVALKHFAL